MCHYVLDRLTTILPGFKNLYNNFVKMNKSRQVVDGMMQTILLVEWPASGSGQTGGRSELTKQGGGPGP